MADEKNKADQEERSDEAQGNDEGQIVLAHDPDASNYLIQPTAHELDPRVGEVPPERFQEEVHKESDEIVGSENHEAHPEENRGPLGIGPDDELPDTTGRGVHRRRES